VPRSDQRLGEKRTCASPGAKPQRTARAHASLSCLSHLVKRLESWGFVRREPDAHDGRYTIAILTDSGYKKLGASAPSHVHFVRELVIEEFSSAELEQLQRLCDRIVARIDASKWKQELT
jgi:DNA-binding MarR family transcriptional regulator